MALDRDQVGLLFKVNADTTDAVQSMQLFRGVVEGMAAETSEQLTRLGSRFSAVGSQVQRTGQQFASSFGDTARGQLAGYVSQFGLLGDAAAGMIPSLTGSAAGLAAIAGGAVAAGAALAGLLVTTTQYAGALNDLKDISNLEIDTLQGLNAGAALVGESFESLTTTTVVFQRQIEAAKKGNTELIALFRALGVDLNGSVDAAFRQAVERLSNLEDGSKKTAIAVELFGRSGTSLLKIMHEMDGSYANLINKADEFGVRLSKDDVEAADRFGKELDILTVKAKGLAYGVGVGLVNAFNAFRDATDPKKQGIALARLFFPEAAAEADRRKAAAQALADQRKAEIQADFEFEQFREQQRLKFEQEQKDKASRGTGARKGTAPTRQEESYQSRLRREQLDEERRLIAESARLRLEAMQDEEDKVIAAMQRIEDEKLRVRLQMAQQNEDFVAQRILGLKLQNLETEGTITNRKLLDLQNERAAQEEAYDMQRVENARQAEEQIRAESKKTYDETVRINRALTAMIEEGKRQRLEADPSSPLSIFGPEGQKAADQGKDTFGQLGASANAALSEVSKQMGNFKSLMMDVFGGIASGLENMIAGFIMTGKLGGQAFKAMTAQILASLTAQAAVKAIFNVAEGFAALALGLPTQATKHFTAAKFYGIVAGVAAAASVGMAAIGGGGGGQGETMFLGQDRRSGSATIEQGYRRRGEPQVIIIRAETEPGVMVSKFVQDYRSNGEARSALRRDILGEF